MNALSSIKNPPLLYKKRWTIKERVDFYFHFSTFLAKKTISAALFVTVIMEAFRAFFNEPWIVVKPPRASAVVDDDYHVVSKKVGSFSVAQKPQANESFV